MAIRPYDNSPGAKLRSRSKCGVFLSAIAALVPCRSAISPNHSTGAGVAVRQASPSAPAQRASAATDIFLPELRHPGGEMFIPAKWRSRSDGGSATLTVPLPIPPPFCFPPSRRASLTSGQSTGNCQHPGVFWGYRGVLLRQRHSGRKSTCRGSSTTALVKPVSSQAMLLAVRLGACPSSD